ncbi:methyltransferase domain-containing protein [Streptomyces nigra]|uniref:methyltransferase domain-containing protein n=1 Tax=Streptomyces nigra TaxID=1827580 RepID=UPI0038063D83
MRPCGCSAVSNCPRTHTVSTWAPERRHGDPVPALPALHAGPGAPARRIREDFPPETFDLVHAGTLLCHLPQREELLHRAVGRVRPGSWLVIEDLSVRPVDASAHPLFRNGLYNL